MMYELSIITTSLAMCQKQTEAVRSCADVNCRWYLGYCQGLVHLDCHLDCDKYDQTQQHWQEVAKEGEHGSTQCKTTLAAW